MELLSISISLLALSISGLTLWLSHLRKGRLKMTRPTVIYFGPDAGDEPSSKLFFRTLLFSSAKRGVVLEHLFVKLRRAETQQNFSIWVYGEKELSRGSGLFIGQEGIATNHHFLLPSDMAEFRFVAGNYELEIYGRTIGQRKNHLLHAASVSITQAEATKLYNSDNGIYFDWGPDSNCYQTLIKAKTSPPMSAQRLLEAFGPNKLNDEVAPSPPGIKP